MTRAIYIRREDGDYGFVAAFDMEKWATGGEGDATWVDQVAEWYRNEREEVLVRDFAGPQFLMEILETPEHFYIPDPEDAKEEDFAWRAELVKQLNALAVGGTKYFPPDLRVQLNDLCDRAADFEDIRFVAWKPEHEQGEPK